MEERPHNPTIIEDEPSHEIYASLIGKNASTILGEPLSSSNKTRRNHSLLQQKALPLSSATAAIIPLSNDEEESYNTPSQSSASSRTKRKKNPQPAEIYKRAFSPTYNAPTLSQLSLDKKNRGFQMLTKMGFNEKDGGLGKHRQGQMVPVKTILKLDRKGLGSGRRKIAKVTHKFKNGADCGDNNNNNGRKLTKSERKRLAKLERDKEQMKAKRARMIISSELDDKYGVFLGL